MSNVTYLLGAGASATALPVVTQINATLNNLIAFLDSLEDFKNDNTLLEECQCPVMNIYTDFLTNLIWLLSNAKDHHSIDTFGRKLRLKGDDKNYKRFKVTLNSFFLMHQQLLLDKEIKQAQFRNYQPYDLRYDTFLASILTENENIIPNNISIISWNYDCQFELAYSKFKECEIALAHQALSIHPYYIQENDRMNMNTKGCIIKLNGGIGYYEKDNRVIWDFRFDFSETRKKILEVLRFYNLCFNPRINMGLKFAWEKDDIQQEGLVKAISKMENSDALVIIGYSFPFYNREIDRQLFNSLNKKAQIYYQYIEQRDKNEREETFIRIKSVSPVSYDFSKQVTPINLNDYFFLPPEL